MANLALLVLQIKIWITVQVDSKDLKRENQQTIPKDQLQAVIQRKIQNAS